MAYASSPILQAVAAVPSLAEMEAVLVDLLADMVTLRYVLVACMTLCVWDWILAFSDELRMLRINSGHRQLSFCLSGLYILLRGFIFGWLLSNFLVAGIAPVIIEVESVPMLYIPPWPTVTAVASMLFDCLTLPTASLLFYIRLSAIYLHDKRAMAFFGLLWSAVMGYFIYDTVQSHQQFASIHLIEPGKNHAWIYITNAIFDTLVYLAVSWKLAAFSTTGNTRQQRFLSFITGEGLLGLTKALLRGGQIYYFTTITIGVANIIFLLSNLIKSAALQGMLAAPHVTIASILACRIFRELKLGILPNTAFPTDLELETRIVFAPRPPAAAAQQPEDGTFYNQHDDGGRDRFSH